MGVDIDVYDDEGELIVIPQTLRETGDSPLEKKNPHPLDSILGFEEVGHHYYVRGIRHDELHYLSSTTFLGTFFPKFDAEKIIGYIMRSKKYSSDPEYKYYRKSEDEILAGWNALGNRASALGSRFHAHAEFHCNNLPVEDNSPEFSQYLNFRNDHPHLVPFRTEMLILEETYRIVGSVDAVFQDTRSKKFFIIDWKRSKKVSSKGGDKGYFPLSHLRSNNLRKYSIQLSLYSYILKNVYGLDMSDAMLVVCHPNQDTYQKIMVPMMTTDVQLMMDYRLLWLYKHDKIPVPEHIMESRDIHWDMIRND